MINDRIEVDFRTSNGKFSNAINYSELDAKTINSIVNNKRIKYIQISKNMPDLALERIDKILELRTDLIFRIYGMYKDNPFDLVRLLTMNNIKNIHIDVLEKKGYRRFANLDSITKLSGVKSLYLDVVGDCDINFISKLQGLECLYLFIGQGEVKLDDTFFYNLNINSLHLGGLATHYLNCLSGNNHIKRLVLFQSCLSNYSFLEQSSIEELYIIGCKMNNAYSFPMVNGVKKLVLAEVVYDKQVLSRFNSLETLLEYDSIYEVDPNEE